jgi:formylglycine-generating enzyme required for sulfatase activity/tRNA A-37 threonylcarbamoyl transferase component Bud32
MRHLDDHGLVGTTVAGKYEIERFVAEGGFAAVYRARHLIWNLPVAIKVFRASESVAEERRAQLEEGFLREGALLAHLSSLTAAIVQARDVGILETAIGRSMPYLVLEWLEGPTLEKVLTEEAARGSATRSIAETIRLLTPIATALGLAHAAGIVHCDVKASNVIVLAGANGDLTLKLVDFGVAKDLSKAPASGIDLAPENHELRSLTPAYAAPEQFSHEYGPTGAWTDVFALALLAVEVASGREPLEGSNYDELAASSTDPARRPTPRTLGVRVNSAVEGVFAKAFAVRPEQRWPNASEFWSALLEALDRTHRTLVSGFGLALAPPESRQASIPATAGTVRPGPLNPGSGAGDHRRRGVGAAAVVGLSLLAAAAVLFSIRGVRRRSDVPPEPSSKNAGPVVVPLATAAQRACPPDMVRVPGGTFFMGSDDGPSMEHPAHPVFVPPFCIDEFEVTVAAYKHCSDVGRCKRAASQNEWDGITEKDHDSFDPLCNAQKSRERENHPVNCVDWFMADRFCRSDGKRLPTEAEWEFAARGPDGRKYPWGDEEPRAELLNACGPECLAWGIENHVDEKALYRMDDGYPNTAPVGSFPMGASPYGIKDMSGNVWEWVADWYAPYPNTDAQERDPHGPPTGDQRILRGGAWNGSYASWVRPTFRYKTDPNQRSYGVGFRCAAASGHDG